MANPQTDDDYQIGTSVGGLVTLASLGIPNPFANWTAGVKLQKLGDNSARILGLPVVVWEWGYISQAARDALRAFCPVADGSNDVFIITPTTETVSTVPNASARYEAQMWWPAPDTPERPQAGRRVVFSVTFKQLVVV